MFTELALIYIVVAAFSVLKFVEACDKNKKAYFSLGYFACTLLSVYGLVKCLEVGAFTL
jgi:hypothetical protein